MHRSLRLVVRLLPTAVLALDVPPSGPDADLSPIARTPYRCGPPFTLVEGGHSSAAAGNASPWAGARRRQIASHRPTGRLSPPCLVPPYRGASSPPPHPPLGVDLLVAAWVG